MPFSSANTHNSVLQFGVDVFVCATRPRVLESRAPYKTAIRLCCTEVKTSGTFPCRTQTLSLHSQDKMLLRKQQSDPSRTHTHQESGAAGGPNGGYVVICQATAFTTPRSSSGTQAPEWKGRNRSLLGALPNFWSLLIFLANHPISSSPAS